eukprot:CAMPEP_0185756516 /NCGR_PEP_ID=MMETSP1174-20130828/14943_1 /TAXON_ID=35687 /ORGANISM="Dictyocha speculum, Strain CCMP1381" /LENGTH=41 /DNA_ID= /DNA_START= /DNA_END= /DNA_ORIENTATION=
MANAAKMPPTMSRRPKRRKGGSNGAKMTPGNMPQLGQKHFQ